MQENILDEFNKLKLNAEQIDYFLIYSKKIRQAATIEIIDKAIQLIYEYENEDIYLVVAELENLKTRFLM